MSRHFFDFYLTDEAGLLCVEYTLRVSYDWEPGQKGDRIDPPIPAGPCDIGVEQVTAAIGDKSFVFDGKSDECRVFDDMIDGSGEAERKFTAAVQEACFDNERDKWDEAREAAAEAKYQAMRDGEL